MLSAGVIEPVDVFEDGDLGCAPGLPGMPPDQFRFYGFEERFDSSVIVAIAPAAHRYLEPMLLQDFLVVMRTVLVATVGVVNTAPRRSAQSNCHFQRSDRQVPHHPITDSPANDAPGM